jgi:4-azaleucine resistance transporter AzlC
MRRVKHTSINRAARAGIPVFPGAFAIGVSFGVLARTEHFGAAAAVVMSATTFAGSSQIAAVSLLGGGGTVAAAIVAALLLNSRYAPIGISVARAFRGRLLRRFGEAQLVVDESWALGNGDRALIVGIGAILWVLWVGGTAVGVALGSVIGDPSRYGIDGAFAALFVALLATQVRSRTRARVAVAGAAIAAVLTPSTPAGVPIVAATAAVLVGWRRA